jgi:predicted KAP-like P-loop ATPase
MASSLKDRLTQLPRPETTIIMDRVLERALQEQEWGTPPILDACLAIAAADPAQGNRLAAFLRERPAAQIKPGIVPRIGDQLWSGGVFSAWQKEGVSQTVKAAITMRGKDGNVTV